MSDFEIRRTVTEEDIPPQAEYRESKYEGIYKSCKTLRKGEGIEIEVGKAHVRSVVDKGLQKRYPRRHYQLTGRKHPDGYRLYIIRK